MSKHHKIEPIDGNEAGPPSGEPEALQVQINLRLRLDEVAAVEATALRDGARRQPGDKELRRLAARIYDARRAREKVLDGELFGEPAWDMLLALFFMPARGEILSVSGLCYVSGVPNTTALRWQDILKAEKLIERGPDELDARRHLVRLTPKARSLMKAYLTRLFYCDMPSPQNEEVIGG